MNCIVDIGNSKSKVYFFDGDILVEKLIFLNEATSEIENAVSLMDFERGILSCSGPIPKFIDNSKFTVLSAQLKLPIALNYQTPQSLGTDRIALAVGAQTLFPADNCLIISAGTCITIDVLTKDGVYQGGIITPGITIRLQSLHTFTENLPLLPYTSDQEHPLIGKSTKESMESGIYNGAIAEVKQIIADFKAIYKDLTVIITGGDTNLFELHLKNEIFAQQNLQAIGLNRILNYNA